MSARLGSALAQHIRAKVAAVEKSFVVVEGVPATVADGMSKAWDDALMPQLAVVSATPERYGRHALLDVSATHLRNQAGGRGVVLVLCDGGQVADRQSLNGFDSVAPSALLDTAEGMGILSQQKPAVGLDGPARAVREAINRAGAATRPSAEAVASYLDRVAAGEDPLRALPALGAFTDHVSPGARADADRIADNLALAAKRTSEDLVKQSAYLDLRRRSESVLRRRPSLAHDPGGLAAATNDVMTKLQSGSSELLDSLRFDEAREIFEQKTQDLAAAVLDEIAAYRSGLAVGSQGDGLPWHRYEARAQSLRRGPDQKAAAQDLRDLDEAQQQMLFTKQTRAKLERLLRDKAVSGSNPSCPEAAFVRAAQQLGGLIDKIQVLAPLPPFGTANRTSAAKKITIACARLRLGALVREWNRAGGGVDGLLLRPVDASDLPDLLASFDDAGLSGGASLPPLQLRLSDDRGNTVQVDWRPDLDDAAMLRAALLFADASQPALTLELDAEPTLHQFCGPIPAVPVKKVPDALVPLARKLQAAAKGVLERGIDPGLLSRWAAEWTKTVAERAAADDTETAEALALAGGVRGGRSAALTFLAPLKAQWVTQYHDALWSLLNKAEEPGTPTDPTNAVATAGAIARTTASHHPAHVRLSTQDRVLLPTSEGRVWSLYGGASNRDESGFAADALRSVVTQLLTLQPEAAGHLRCTAWGPGAADLLVSQAVKLIGTRAGGAVIGRVEIFCIGGTDQDRPLFDTLAWADDQLRGARDVLELRYIDTLEQALEMLRPADDSPAVHLALVTGLTQGGRLLQIESPEVDLPREDDEVLFAPRVWQRPRQDRRTLLMPPATTSAGRAWLCLQNAVEDSWPADGDKLRVPEVKSGAQDLSVQLQQVHELALWVATLDRYATRDSLEQALGREKVAILHQERRLGGDSPLSLVLSQKSGGPADRAIGRSLRAAGIVAEPDVALSIGTDLRKVASQGYGILALQAATSGAGINELVGHVVAFSLLATATTPWPLPPGCRVLLVSLDEYRHWFPAKRADLLAIALDPREGGVHIAAIEVKARRSDETDAASGALDQLNQTLASTRWAAYPVPGSVHSRLWLNRIAEAAYAVARESRFKLDTLELQALEAFRLGRGTLEWAGVGLVFGPKVAPFSKTYLRDREADVLRSPEI